MSELKQSSIDVHLHDGVLVTTSRNIAGVFGKRHALVLYDIRNLLSSSPDPEFGHSNFIPSTYITAQNKELTQYLLTRDGALSLIMGYTGPKSTAFKMAYIKRFDEMEQLSMPTNATPIELPPLPAPLLEATPLNLSVPAAGSVTRDQLEVYSLVLEKAGLKGQQLALALDKAVRAATGQSVLELADVQLEDA